MAAAQGPQYDNTLDETVGETLKRDIRAIGKNVANVLMPVSFQGKKRSHEERMGALIKDWDLWGPLVFSLFLALAVSIGSPSPSKVFTIVYGILIFGGAVTTLNVNLLGGKIAFFQSMCLLGYCLFPITFGALICIALRHVISRLVMLCFMLVWSSWASVPFIGGTLPVSKGGKDD